MAYGSPSKQAPPAEAQSLPAHGEHDGKRHAGHAVEGDEDAGGEKPAPPCGPNGPQEHPHSDDGRQRPRDAPASRVGF